MSNSPAISAEAIDNLRSLSPDDGDSFLKEIISIFLEDTPKRVEDLHSSRASADTPAFVRAAHSIKGSSSNLGAMELRDIAERLEHHARQHGMVEVDEQVAALEAAFLRAKAELEKLAVA
jgi:histidine phosphotransfer protein HptB